MQIVKSVKITRPIPKQKNANGAAALTIQQKEAKTVNKIQSMLNLIQIML
jgi:hypothetical protein